MYQLKQDFTLRDRRIPEGRMEDDLDSESLARVNITAFGNWTDLTPEDFEEIGLTDLQTVILACLATLIPLTIALITALIARCFWKRYLKRKAIRCQGSLHRIESSDPRHTLQSSCDEMKTSESQFSVIPPEEVAEVMSVYSNGTALNTKTASNGSIITLTMRNNHLIVEKEERIPGVTPLPSKPFISQGDTTIYTVDVEEESFREYAMEQQYSGCNSVSRTTSRDLLIHREGPSSEDRSNYYEGRSAGGSGYSVVPEDNYLQYRQAWGDSDDDYATTSYSIDDFPIGPGPMSIEVNSRLPLPKIEEEYDENVERRKLDQLQKEKQDIQDQIRRYQEILQKENAELLTTFCGNQEKRSEDEDSDDEIVVVEDDDLDDDVDEEDERDKIGKEIDAANKILILNNDHLHNITLAEAGSPGGSGNQVTAGRLERNTICENGGEKTDVEDLDDQDDWSTGFSDDDEDVRQDYQVPIKDSKDFYRIENRKYDNLACMAEKTTEAEIEALPRGTGSCSPPRDVSNVDDYADFYEGDEDDEDDDRSNLENVSVTTEINVCQSALAADKRVASEVAAASTSGAVDSDEEKATDEFEKSKSSSSSSRGSYQNDYSYGNQSEYMINELPSTSSSSNNSCYYKQSAPVLEIKLPAPPSPFQNSYKVREEENRELIFIEQQHQLGKGFNSELSLPGEDNFLSRTIISNNLSDSSDLN